MISMLANLLKALNSESGPGQIALAFSLALITGLTPLLSFHNLLILFLACIIRINFGAFILGTLFFSGLAYLLDPIFMSVGESLLLNESLQTFWTGLYQSNFWRITEFNNTLVLGSLVVALVLFLPVLLLSRWLVTTYRERVMTWVNTLKITKILKASSFYKIYQTLAE